MPAQTTSYNHLMAGRSTTELLALIFLMNAIEAKGYIFNGGWAER